MPARTLVESIAFINAEQSAFLKEHGDPKFCGSLGAFGFRYRSSSSSPLSFRMIPGPSPVSTGAWSACLGSLSLHSGFLLFLGIIQVILCTVFCGSFALFRFLCFWLSVYRTLTVVQLQPSQNRHGKCRVAASQEVPESVLCSRNFCSEAPSLLPCIPADASLCVLGLLLSSGFLSNFLSIT